MTKITVFFITILAIFSQAKAQLKTPESAQFYKGKIYVSNIGNLPPNKKDKDGFIAVFNGSGKFEKILIKGLNAPKGIAFKGNKLFVTDINEIKVININNGKIEKIIEIKGAKFLNDIVIHKNIIYVSDTQKNTIYNIPIDTFIPKIFIKSYELNGPNGLIFRKEKLICVSWNSGNIFYVNKNKIEKIAHINGNLDGIIETDKGNLLVSDFKNGKIYKVDKNGKIKVLINALISPADIGYNEGKLAIPEFYGNRVIIKKVK